MKNQNQEHYESYYAATANDKTDYPALEGGTMEHFDFFEETKHFRMPFGQ